MKNRILIIDDDNALVDLYSTSLSQNDYEVLRASDGIEGLRVLRAEKKIDLVLLDLKMPKMSGEKFLRVLRNDKELRDTKVLVMSSTVGNWDNEDNQGRVHEIRNLREEIARDAEKFGGKQTIIDGKFEKTPFIEKTHEFNERIRTEIINKVREALKKLTYNVLFIEVDRELAKVCSAVLKENGYGCYLGKTDLDAFEILKNQRIDLILLDLDKSKLKPDEFIENVRSEPDFKNIKFLMLSSKPPDLKLREKNPDILFSEKKFKKQFLWYMLAFKYNAQEIKDDLLKQISIILNNDEKQKAIQ